MSDASHSRFLELCAWATSRSRRTSAARHGARRRPVVADSGPASQGALRGGLAFVRDKPGLESPVLDVPVPPLLFIPLLGYRAQALTPCVAIGERVERGAPLAPGLPASASGTIIAIGPHPVAHPAWRDAPTIVLETDAESLTTGETPCHAPLDALTPERLAHCGVTGLGGAGFPTSDKFSQRSKGEIHTLVINAAECEPGISCDEALMRESADEVVAGALALSELAGAERTLIVIESDKQAALTALQAHAVHPAIELIVIAPVYPSGAERVLLRLATGIDVKPPQRPADHGVLCVNVATARAACRAQLGFPSVQRIVTLGGARMSRTCNVRVTLGTPLTDVLNATAQVARAPDTRCRVGGPLSGFDVHSEQVPVTATMNRIALEPPRSTRTVLPCIRCAACSDVCPVGLLPQELLRHARNSAAEALARGGLQTCLECGCCDAVCPSSIALTATFRHARGQARDALRQEKETHRSEALHRRREARVQRLSDEAFRALHDPGKRGGAPGDATVEASPHGARDAPGTSERDTKEGDDKMIGNALDARVPPDPSATSKTASVTASVAASGSVSGSVSASVSASVAASVTAPPRADTINSADGAPGGSALDPQAALARAAQRRKRRAQSKPDTKPS